MLQCYFRTFEVVHCHSLDVCMPVSSVRVVCCSLWPRPCMLFCLCADFSDLQRDGKQSVSRLSSFGQPSTATVTLATTSESSAGQPGESCSASSTVNPLSSQAPSPRVEAGKDATAQASSGEAGSTGPAVHQNPEPGVSAPRDAGSNPWQLNSSRTAGTGESEVAGSEGEGDGPSKRKPGRQRIHDWRRPIEKPRLYSMNPFCVPIRLLRFKPLPTASPSAASTASQSSVFGSQPEPSTSSCPQQKKLKNVNREVNQEIERNSIRQVTGLYKPTVPTTRKKKEALHKTLLPAKMQVSSATMNAMKAALAQRSQQKALVRSNLTPAGVTQAPRSDVQGAQTQSRPIITLPGGQKLVQVTNKGNNSSTIPTHAFRCVQLPGGKMALVPIAVPKPGSGVNPTPSMPEVNIQLPRPQEPLTPEAVPAGVEASPSVSSSSSLFQSPLRAPVAGCSVSVGTSDENASEVPVVITSCSGSSSPSGEEPQASANLSEETATQQQTSGDEQISEDSQGRSSVTAVGQDTDSDSCPEVTRQADASPPQSSPVSSSSCRSDTARLRAAQLQQAESSAAQPQQVERGTSQSQPVKQRTAQPQLVEQRAIQQEQVEQRAAQLQPVEQRAALPQADEQRPVQPRPAKQRAAGPQSVKQRVAQPRPVDQMTRPRPVDHRTSQPKPAEQRRPSAIQSTSTENVTVTEKQSSSVEVSVRQSSADGLQTEGTRSLDISFSGSESTRSLGARTVQSGSSDCSAQSKSPGQKLVVRSVSDDSEVTSSGHSSESRTVARSSSVDQLRPVDDSADSGPGTVVRSVSCKSSSVQNGQAVVVKTLTRSRFSRRSAADWSRNTETSSSDPEVTRTTSGNVKSSSSDDDSPSVRFSQPLKTYTRTPCLKATDEKARLISVKAKVTAQSEKNHQKILQPISKGPKPPQPREAGQKPPCIIYVSPKTPLATDASQKTPPSVTMGKKMAQSVKMPWSAKACQPGKTPKSAKSPLSSDVGKKASQSQSSTVSKKTVQSTKTLKSGSIHHKTPQPTNASQQVSDCQSSSTNRETPKSAPSRSKQVKSTFKTILAQVASPHVASGKQTSTPKRPRVENASRASSQNSSVAASPTDPQACSSSSLSPNSSPSPPKKLKLAKKFLAKQEPAEEPAGARQLTPAPPGKRRKKSAGGGQPSYSKAKKRPANFLDKEDITNMRVEYVTMDAAKKRMKLPAGSPEKGYEVEREQRLESAMRSGRTPLRMRLDDEEISLVSI